jgi:hypothetical protein
MSAHRHPARGITPPEVTAVCDILLEASIKLPEVPLNSPNAMASIEIAAKQCMKRKRNPETPWFDRPCVLPSPRLCIRRGI